MSTPLPRGRRTGLATVVALAVLTLAVLGAIAAIQIHADRDRTVLGRASWVVDRLGTRDWTDVGVLVAGVACAVLGLLLLLAGLLPARRTLVTLADPDEHTVAGITRAGLRRDLAAVAAATDGIASAKASLGRRTVTVTARSPLRDATGLAAAVDAAVAQRLTALQVQRPLTVRTRIRPGGD